MQNLVLSRQSLQKWGAFNCSNMNTDIMEYCLSLFTKHTICPVELSSMSSIKRVYSVSQPISTDNVDELSRTSDHQQDHLRNMEFYWQWNSPASSHRGNIFQYNSKRISSNPAIAFTAASLSPCVAPVCGGMSLVFINILIKPPYWLFTKYGSHVA